MIDGKFFKMQFCLLIATKNQIVLFLGTLRMIMVIMQNHQRTLIKGQTVSLTHFVLDVAMETTGKGGYISESIFTLCSILKK